MKKIALLSLTSLFVLVLAGSAWACHFDQFTPTADCDGWNIAGTIVFSSDVTYADLDYTVHLMQGTALVKEFSGSERIMDTSPDFAYGEGWGMELCGDYSVIMDLHFVSDGPGYEDWEHFETTFTCDCPPPPPEGCSRTQGYWKTHPDAWPQTDFTVGCVAYTQMEMLNILWMPVRGDMTIQLFHQLVAAKLSVWSGAPDLINGTIGDADDFLCAHPLFSKPKGDLKTEAGDLKTALDDYNNKYDCDGADVMPMPTMGMMATPAENANSWGAVKASYK